MLEKLPPSQVVLCKAGDLCLWDSRTIHCNTPSVEKIPKSQEFPMQTPKDGWDMGMI